MGELYRASETQNAGFELGTAGDFFRSAAYSGLAKPVEGASQIAHALSFGLVPEAKFQAPESHSLMNSAGSLAGSVLDYIAVSKAVGAGFAGRGVENTVANTFLREGTAGAAYMALMPTEGNGNFFLNKARDMGVGFGTFGAMGASARWLGDTGVFSTLGSNSLLRDVALNGAAGGIGGAVNAELTSFGHGRGLASGSELVNDTLGYAAFGAAFGGANHAFGRIGRAVKGEGFSFPWQRPANSAAYTDGMRPEFSTATGQFRDFSAPQSGGDTAELRPTLRPPSEEIDLTDIPLPSKPPLELAADSDSMGRADRELRLNLSHRRAMDEIADESTEGPKGSLLEQFRPLQISGTAEPAVETIVDYSPPVVAARTTPLVVRDLAPSPPLTTAELRTVTPEIRMGLGGNLKRDFGVDGQTEPVGLGTRRPDYPSAPNEKISAQGQYAVSFPEQSAQISLHDGHVHLEIGAHVDTAEAYDMAMATEFTRLALMRSDAAEAARAIPRRSIGFKSQELINEHHSDPKAFEQAAEGSLAYVRGQEGNYYTRYLEERYGKWPSVKALSEITPRFERIQFTPDQTPWRREWMALHPNTGPRVTSSAGLDGMMREVGGFNDAQVADPRLRLLTYHFGIDRASGIPNVQALGVASRFHHIDNILEDPSIIRTYREMIASGWTPDQATTDGTSYRTWSRWVAGQEVPAQIDPAQDNPAQLVFARDYAPPREYYAARALQEARSRFAPTPEYAQVFPTPEVLADILADPRYAGTAPPSISLEVYRDVANRALERAQAQAAEPVPGQQLELPLER